jgi:hypothetical protein
VTPELSPLLASVPFTGGTPVASTAPHQGEPEQMGDYHTRFLDEHGKLASQEHVRDDGTVVASHHIDEEQNERVILYLSDGTPFVEWNRFDDLYIQWVSHLIVDEPSVLIVDGARLASVLQQIRPRNFKLIHFVHVAHLKAPHNGVHGEYIQDRLEAFRNHDQFDIVAVQTQRQIDDMAQRGMSPKRMRLLPSLGIS